MTAIVAAMQRLAQGDMTDDIPARNQSDEIGAMADALGVFRDNAIEKVHFQDLATTDTLTGIRNRLKFIQTLEAEVLRHQRYGSPLSLVMMDIDHFKRINDTFGHAAGDVTLQQVAAVVTQRIRVTDTFALGGARNSSCCCLKRTPGRPAQIGRDLARGDSGSGFRRGGPCHGQFRRGGISCRR